jgi:hypothetical protein
MGHKIKELAAAGGWNPGMGTVSGNRRMGTCGNYWRNAVFYLLFCINRNKIPFPGMTLAGKDEQFIDHQGFIFWHFFPILIGITRKSQLMKTNITLTLALISALLVSGINKVSAQEVTEASATPALMLSFSGNSQGSMADLQWVMENETNCKWFVIERSGENGGFDSIDVVMGINNGNETSYGFTDPNMLQGCNWYRIREVDATGAERYSKVVMLSNNQVSAKMEIYPNPAVATINFSIASPATQQVLVQVYSLSGVMMIANQQELAAGNNLQTVAIGNLKAGNYILKVSSLTGSTQYVQPFVKII